MFNTPRTTKKKKVEENNNYQSDGAETDENYCSETDNVNNFSNDVGGNELESE